MKTRQIFIEALDSLNQEILRLGILVQNALRMALNSLMEKDRGAAQRVIEEDAAIDRMELEIEDRCIEIIAKEQPVATDLRRLVTSLKIVTQLERMGDYARHIAKATITLADETYMKPLLNIPRMGEICIDMIHRMLSAFIDNDSDEAERVAALDEDVDNLNEQVIREVFTYMMENPKYISQSITLIFVSRYLERIADRVTNIGEWVIYIKTGEHKELNP
jgi:phosphate transport system protein